MRKILLLALLAAPLLAAAQDHSADSTWFMAHYTKQEVNIAMRDGVKLFTTIYSPIVPAPGRGKIWQKNPILITRTPYSCNPYGEEYAKIWNTPKMEYARKNYILVIQDVRGRYMSEGDFMDVRPYNHNKEKGEIDEASDTYDAIDWLVKNVKNNNGKVGVYGVSYPGFYATMAALCGHPALKAVSPQAPVTEWFIGDDFHHNGAFMEMDAFNFYSSFGKPRHGLVTKSPAGFQYYTKDNYKFYLETGPVRNLARLLGDSVAFWKELYSHPDYDQWWKVRNTRSHVQHIPDNVATLVVGGLFDAEDCFGAWNLYKAIEYKAHNNNKLVMGPWSHGGWARGTGEYLGNIRFRIKNSEWYQQNVEIPFFDKYLLGKSYTKNVGEATIFFTGINKWRVYPKWPPKNTDNKSLYLHGDGALTWTLPYIDEEIKYKKYTSDPAKPVPYAEGVHQHRTNEYMNDDQRFAGRRTDVLVYKSDTLKNDVTVAGPVIADLFTSISTTDADFVVKIIDVFPDNFAYRDSIDGKGSGKEYPMGGYEMLVRGEVMRGRYRNSFEHPEPFEPFRITEVKYKLPDIAHVFKKGHRIMIQVQSTWFPLVDRNPQQFVDIYKCSEMDFIPCDVKIYSSREHPSKVILPVVY